MSVVSTDREPNRWAVLALLGVAQLMVVLDATIVTIAIPSAQKALGFSTESRQWIITAYALAFGSLLLLGGKLGDLFGRKWTLLAGLVGFSIASALGGLAQSFAVLSSSEMTAAGKLTPAGVQLRKRDRLVAGLAQQLEQPLLLSVGERHRRIVAPQRGAVATGRVFSKAQLARIARWSRRVG
jgi:MFS family permease